VDNCEQKVVGGWDAQYPYKAISAADNVRINIEVSAVLKSIEDLLYQRVRKRARGQIDEDQIQEIVQRCRIWLWEKSLPKYDAKREPHVRVSTYLFQCADNYVRQELRSLSRRRIGRKKMTYVDPDLMLHTVRANDTHLDERIAIVAEDVLCNPGRYLTAAQVEVFNAMVNSPGILMKDLAKGLGYKRASSLSMMVRRIKERIKEIDLEEWQAQK
jgi:DNA-directed RNA polymerase specialized sigma24 family protein